MVPETFKPTKDDPNGPKMVWEKVFIFSQSSFSPKMLGPQQWCINAAPYDYQECSSMGSGMIGWSMLDLRRFAGFGKRILYLKVYSQLIVNLIVYCCTWTAWTIMSPGFHLTLLPLLEDNTFSTPFVFDGQSWKWLLLI
jgi:hypothetical protein